MRIVIQRVLEASVKVGDKVVGKIDKGLLVLLGINSFDTFKEADYLSKKLLNLRIWNDLNSNKRWDKSVMDLNYEVLLVSQFTLYSILKGNKPDFHLAMDPEKAKDLYNYFAESLRKNYKSNMIQEGEFGGYMLVSSTNDGPVTINIEYPEVVDNSIDKQDQKDKKTNMKKDQNNDKSKNKVNKVENLTEKIDKIIIDDNDDKINKDKYFSNRDDVKDDVETKDELNK